MYPQFDFTPKGWECPKCGAVMAPFMTSCMNCTGHRDSLGQKIDEIDKIGRTITERGMGRGWTRRTDSTTGDSPTD